MKQTIIHTNTKIHPHKFTMWLALGSMIMLFAGFSSAYLVKSHQAHWQHIALPTLFYYSTVAILLTSVSLWLSHKALQHKSKKKFIAYCNTTIILGLLFMMLQLLAFKQLTSSGVLINGNVAGSFIYVIAIVHIAHILGGIIGLVFLRKKYIKNFAQMSIIPLEVFSIYWHFIDLLWVYLLLFFTFAG